MKSLDLFAGPGGWDEGLRPQVGNAVPPLMARAIVGSLVGASSLEEAA